MTQKEIAYNLIYDTLYRNLSWRPTKYTIRQKEKTVHLTSSCTLWKNNIVTIFYDKKRILVNGKRQRLPRELSADLLSLVKLKTKKFIKHVKFD